MGSGPRPAPGPAPLRGRGPRPSPPRCSGACPRAVAGRATRRGDGRRRTPRPVRHPGATSRPAGADEDHVARRPVPEEVDPDEVGDVAGAGPLGDLLRRAGLGDPARLQHDQPFGQRDGLDRVVRHQQPDAVVAVELAAQLAPAPRGGCWRRARREARRAAGAGARVASARASATRWAWPPDSCCGLLRRSPPGRPGRAICGPRPRASASATPRLRRPNATFSRAERWGKSR